MSVSMASCYLQKFRVVHHPGSSWIRASPSALGMLLPCMGPYSVLIDYSAIATNCFCGWVDPLTSLQYRKRMAVLATWRPPGWIFLITSFLALAFQADVLAVLCYCCILGCYDSLDEWRVQVIEPGRVLLVTCSGAGGLLAFLAAHVDPAAQMEYKRHLFLQDHGCSRSSSTSLHIFAWGLELSRHWRGFVGFAVSSLPASGLANLAIV